MEGMESIKALEMTEVNEVMAMEVKDSEYVFSTVEFESIVNPSFRCCIVVLVNGSEHDGAELVESTWH